MYRRMFRFTCVRAFREFFRQCSLSFDVSPTNEEAKCFNINVSTLSIFIFHSLNSHNFLIPSIPVSSYRRSLFKQGEFILTLFVLTWNLRTNVQARFENFVSYRYLLTYCLTVEFHTTPELKHETELSFIIHELLHISREIVQISENFPPFLLAKSPVKLVLYDKLLILIVLVLMRRSSVIFFLL